MGQQGKFLLNRVPENMVWKYNIQNKFNKNNIYLNSRMISQIITFLLKKDIYLLYFRKKKLKFNLKKNYNVFLNLELYLRKRVKNFMRKIFYSQLRITRLGEWFIINVVIFTTFKSKNKLLIKTNEVYFRLRHYYHYLTPKLNQFKLFWATYIHALIAIVFLCSCIYLGGVIAYYDFIVKNNLDFDFKILNIFVSYYYHFKLKWLKKWLNDNLIKNVLQNQYYNLFTKKNRSLWFYILRGNHNRFWLFRRLIYIIIYCLKNYTYFTLIIQYTSTLFVFFFIISLTIWTRAAGPRVRPDQLLTYTVKLFILSLIIVMMVVALVNYLSANK